MVYSLDDTIVAPATASIESALAIIRISGPSSRQIAEDHLVSSAVACGGEMTPSAYRLHLEPWRVHHGYFLDRRSSTLLDEILVVFFEKPRSYTGEHLVEITCHGGLLVIQEILDCLLDSGARLAQPGEFTFRAFANGRLDLTQAEAVNDIIRAQSRHDLTMSMKQLAGSLSQEITEVNGMLRDLYSRFVMSIDFAEEDVPGIDEDGSVAVLDRIIVRLERLILSSKTARSVKDGLSVPIVGSPNIGKSSLMNRLLGTERSIVTPHPGTTRDFIDARIQFGGVLFTLIDTAGIRTPDDPVEEEGVKRTRQLMERADLLIVLLNPQPAPDETDLLILGETRGKARILAFNKVDTVVEDTLPIRWEDETIHHLSIKTGQGVAQLVDDLGMRGRTMSMGIEEELSRHGSWLANKRQIDACRRALEGVVSGHRALLDRKTADMIAFDIEEAMQAFDYLLGKTTADDILGDIFAHFCIGK